MTMQQNNTAPIANSSEGDNMPDIQTLTSQVEQLERAAGWWNNATLWLVAGTALVAAAYFVVSLISSNRSNALKDAQAALIRAKDEQLALNLKDKDEQISAAKERASTADRQAGIANEAAGKANRRAEEIAGENIKLKSDLDMATAEARREAENLRKQNLATEDRLEKERRSRLEMERVIGPRIIAAQEAIANSLSQFKGMRFEIQSLADMESRRLASQIAATLKMAGWELPMDRMAIVGDGTLPEGVTVVVSDILERPEGDQSAVAAVTLVEQLMGQMIEAEFSPSKSATLDTGALPHVPPPSTITIQVGIKPILRELEYFMPPEEKKRLERIREQHRQGNIDLLKRIEEWREARRDKPE
jgi:hypothetical protein